MGLRKRALKVPRSSHGTPSAATTGWVIHAYTVTPGTRPPRKPSSRASPSSWILFSVTSAGIWALTRWRGSVLPAASVARLIGSSVSLLDPGAVAARPILLLVPLGPLGVALLALERARLLGRPHGRHDQRLILRERTLPPLS